jgi:hypothetical protein
MKTKRSFSAPGRKERRLRNNTLETNILSIAGAGLLVLLTGVFFFVFRDSISKNIRYFLPIPPLAVAAYIFVFNLFVHYDGVLPENLWDVAKEVTYSTVISSVAFFVFTLLLVFFIGFVRRLL